MLGVVALDVDSDAADLPSLLRGDAAMFRPHVTILPRFEIDADLHLNHAIERFTIALEGPRRIGAELICYECLDGRPGYEALVALHVELSGRLSNTLRPIEPTHWGGGFRAHLTLGPAIDSSSTRLPNVLEATPYSLTFYCIEPGPPQTVIRFQLRATAS